MKKIFILFAFSTLFSQEQDFSYWDVHPLHAGGNGIAIGKADVKLKRGDIHSGELTFNKANAFLYMLVPVSRTTFFFPRVEYNYFTMNWNKNPFFKQTEFQYLQFALTLYSTAIDKWRWILRGEYNIDAENFSKPGKYGLVSALLWGTHELHRKWHMHVGAFGYTGFEGEMVYPIIGFDYAPNKKWLFQAVFPINYSIEYNLTSEWRLSLKGRPLKERFRTGKDEVQPRSVFCYSTMGAEFNVHYEKFLRLEAEAFVGYNFGGSYYIKNQRGHRGFYTNVEGAPYVGASLNWGF